MWKNIHSDFTSWSLKKNWVEKGFDYDQTQQWIEAGLETYEYDLASYLKEKGYEPTSKNIENLIKQGKNAQEWFESEYPLKKRDDITSVFIIEKGLGGSLKIEGFKKLKPLDLWKNRINKLEIINCPKLTKIDLRSNQLTDLFFLSQLNPKILLAELKIYNNNFQPSDLSYFVSFTNLKKLEIGTVDEKRIEKGFYNRFYGSLEPLKNLIKLEELCIESTDIDEGLEYLPESLEIFRFSSYRINAKVRRIGKILEPFNGNLKKWRIAGKPLLNREEELENQIERLAKLIKRQKEKIITAYTHFFIEKELLKDLIDTHLGYSKTRKQKLPSIKLKKAKEKLFDKLMEKIGEEAMEEIEIILSDCDELIHYEAELEEEIRQNKKLITGSQQIVNYITYNYSGNFKIESGSMISGSITTGNNTDFSNKINQLTITEMETKSEILSKNLPIKRPRGDSWKDNDFAKKPCDEMTDWVNIHSSFSNQQLIQGWTSNNFTYREVKEWFNVFGDRFNPQEVNFYLWLRDVKGVDSSWVLNQGNWQELNQDFFHWYQQQLQFQIQIPQNK